MTADGKIAFAHDRFTPFSSERDREHMMELRAIADAVICGATTVDVTGTILGNGGERYRKQRLKTGLREFPLRIVVSGAGSIDPGTNIFKKRFSPVIVLVSECIPKPRLKALRAVADAVEVFGPKKVDFPAAFRWLRKQWDVRRLLCEGGGELHNAMVQANVMDELHLTVCPIIFGGRKAPTIAEGSNLEHLADAKRFRLASFQRLENEIFTVWRRRRDR